MKDCLNEDFLVRSDHYDQTMNTLVLPWLEERKKTVSIAGYGGRPLHCAVFSDGNPRATVFLLHGFTENYLKFSELIHSLVHCGFSVVAYDQRGHGNSWRCDGLQDVGDTHVDHFEEYVLDLRAVTDHFLSSAVRPWYIIAHSMGGAVASLFLEQYPDVFSKAVLCSPMIAPYPSGISYMLASLVCRIAVLAGRGRHRVFTSKPYQGPEDFQTSCVSDPVRFAWYDAIKVSHPEYQNCSPTYSWTNESLHVRKTILAKGAPERIACPVRLFAAENDNMVQSAPQEQFVARLRNGTRKVVARSKHEIYRSEDDVLFPWWHEILDFLKESGQPSA